MVKTKQKHVLEEYELVGSKNGWYGARVSAPKKYTPFTAAGYS